MNAKQPLALRGADIGHEFRDTPEARFITQLSSNTETFDFRPYQGCMDLAFVDAAHDYPHVRQDSRNALKLVKPGGWVVWHDVSVQWHGVVRAVSETCAAAGLQPIRIFQTTLAVVQV
ncbi:MAG TPA: class I SAM-dependent methyltransferase [Ktedonobacterales bacterium]|nr:class I SAM-dependent methyltransferase [Ktedonobacterales bacterium]